MTLVPTSSASERPTAPKNPLYRLFSFWTDNDVALLRNLARNRVPVAVIAMRLYRSTGSIRSKAEMINVKLVSKRDAFLTVDLSGVDEIPVFMRGGFIVEKVAEAYGLSPDAIRSPSRDAYLVQARHHAIHLIAKLTDLSFPRMAKVVGRHDHTTIIHAIRITNDRTGENVRGLGGVRLERILAWKRFKAAKKAAKLAERAAA